MATLEFSRRYAMAHRLLADPASKCAIPHGHNEIVSVRLTPANGFRFGGANALAPFEAVKGRWHRWIDNHVDHALQLNNTDPLIGFFRELEPARLDHVMTFEGDPTTEALAACFWLKLGRLHARGRSAVHGERGACRGNPHQRCRRHPGNVRP